MFCLPVTEVPGLEFLDGDPIGYLPVLFSRSWARAQPGLGSCLLKAQLQVTAVIVVAVDYHYDAPVVGRPMGIALEASLQFLEQVGFPLKGVDAKGERLWKQPR